MNNDGKWTQLDQLADEAARAWAAANGGWPGVVADRAFREGWKVAAAAVPDKQRRGHAHTKDGGQTYTGPSDACPYCGPSGVPSTSNQRDEGVTR